MILFTDGKENLKSYPHRIALDDAARKNMKINAVVTTAKDFMMMPNRIDLNGNFQFSTVKAEPIDSFLIRKNNLRNRRGF